MSLSEQAKDVIIGYLGKGGKVMLELIQQLPKEVDPPEIMEEFFKELEKIRKTL